MRIWQQCTISLSPPSKLPLSHFCFLFLLQGGTTAWPTYKSIGDHFEVTMVEFDPTTVAYDQLLEMYFNNHTPTYKREGKNQYNPGAWFQRGTTQEKQLTEAMATEAKVRGQELATTVGSLPPFYYGEEYHQKFSNRALLNGNQGVAPTSGAACGLKLK